MKNYIEEIVDEQCVIRIVRHFYFKVNDFKLKDERLFDSQVNKVLERIKEKYKLLNNEITLTTGTIDDDFIYSRFRLKITVNCA